MLASLSETCKLHRVNPEAYFTDVLTKLVNNWPNRRRAELCPGLGPLIRAHPINRRSRRFSRNAYTQT